MLAISVLTMLASGGLTWIATALWVMQAAHGTGTTSDARGGATHGAIVVLGHRLEPDAAPSSAFRARLARAALMARGMRIKVEPCAAEPGLDAAGLTAIPREAFLLHWYVTGRSVAWLLNSQKLAARVT